jgi:hypothetical protein
MTPFQRMVLGLAFLMLGVVLPVAGLAAEVDEQRDVATQFIRYYFLSDLKHLAPTLHRSGCEMFGPYPLQGNLRLGNPKVDDNQALQEFTADTADRKFHTHGGILFKRDKGRWLVRQVMFYNRVPRLFNLPSKSKTKKDRAQESTVRAVGNAFMVAWEHNDRKKMMSLWYDWTKKKREPVQGLSVSRIALMPGRTAWNDPYMGYSAKLTYRFGILSYSMDVKGGLMMVEDNGKWRVRANTVVLDF